VPEEKPQIFYAFNKFKKAALLEQSNTETVGSYPVRIMSCSLWFGAGDGQILGRKGANMIIMWLNGEIYK